MWQLATLEWCDLILTQLITASAVHRTAHAYGLDRVAPRF